MTKHVAKIIAETTHVDYTDAFRDLVPEGGEPPKPRTLQSYLDEFGGSWEGELEDPFGFTHHVSFAALQDEPRDIYVRVGFVVRDVAGAPFPPDHPGTVVLKEYDLPDGFMLPE